MTFTVPQKGQEWQSMIQLVVGGLSLVSAMFAIIYLVDSRESSTLSKYHAVNTEQVTNISCQASMTDLSGDVGDTSAVLNASFGTSVSTPPIMRFNGLHLWGPYTLTSGQVLYDDLMEMTLYSIEMVALNNQTAMVKVQWRYTRIGGTSAASKPNMLLYSALFANISANWTVSPTDTPVFIFHPILKMVYRGVDCAADWTQTDDAVVIENGCLANELTFSLPYEANSIRKFIADKDWGNVACQTYYEKQVITHDEKNLVQVLSCMSALACLALVAIKLGVDYPKVRY